MKTIHQSDLQDFIKAIKPPACCIIHDTSDTHFARAYFVLWGNGVPGREYQFLVTGYQNFVSDYRGRRESIMKGLASFQEIARGLEEKDIELGRVQLRVSGRYPVLEDEETREWWAQRSREDKL